MDAKLIPILFGAPIPINRNGLVAYYDFREAAGQTVRDLKGGYDATLGSTAGADANDPTWVGKTLDFVTDDYIEAAALPDASVTGAITLTLVARVDTGAAFRSFMHKHAGNGATASPFEWRTTSDATPKLVFIRAHAAGANLWAASTSTATLGAWRCYSLTAGPLMESAATFYVGTTAETIAAANGNTGAVTGSNAALRIGQRPDGAVALDGAVAFAAIYSRALSAGEIAQNYSVFKRLAARRGIAVT